MASRTRRINGILTIVTETVRLKILPPRRLTAAQRREIQRSIANDPEVARAVHETVLARPQFGNNGSATTGLQGQPKP